MNCPHCHKEIEEYGHRSEDDQQLISTMRPYILMAKEAVSGGLSCEQCGKQDKHYHLHHKNYGSRITIRDLAVLCRQCHLNIPTVRVSDGLIE